MHGGVIETHMLTHPTGASPDLQQGTSMAKQMVINYGFCDIGPWSLIYPPAQQGDMIMRMMARHSMARNSMARNSPPEASAKGHPKLSGSTCLSLNSTLLRTHLRLHVEYGGNLGGSEVREYLPPHKQVDMSLPGLPYVTRPVHYVDAAVHFRHTDLVGAW